MTNHSKRKNNLFSEFPPVSRKQWEAQIKNDLKGADYKEKLKWNTLEGFDMLPFYRSDNLTEFHRDPLPLPDQWQYCEPVTEPDPSVANTLIKEAVKGGMHSVSIRCEATPHSGALGGDISGVQIQSQKDMAVLLEDIPLSEIHLFFDSGMISPAMVAMLQNHLSRKVNASFLFDPFTYVARHGRMPLPEEELDNLIQHLCRQPELRTLGADARFYQEAGATLVQETGIALAIGSEFLARCKKQDADKAAESLFVRISAGPLYFPEIAKIRALRILWPQMMKAYGVKNPGEVWIHSETTESNQTVTDAHTNMLRATTEAMSAALGGTNSLVVHPYDSRFRKPDAFSRRIARNIHHILKEEAGFAKVTDAAAGSYYLEKLTDTIAEKSWEFFQLIEKQGGFLKALQNRVIQNALESSRSEKENAYAEKKKILIGTNQYPNPEEDLPDSTFRSEYVSSLLFSGETYVVNKERISGSLKQAFLEGASVGDIIGHILSPQKVLYPTLAEYRPGSIYEEIRKKTSEQTRMPVVALVPVGDPAWRRTRVSFAQNTLGCGGFSIIRLQGFDSLEDARQELADTDADIFVLCSSDKEYPVLVHDFCSIFSGNHQLLILAGKPEKKREQFLKAGIDYFIYSGMNLPELLVELQQRLFEKETA